MDWAEERNIRILDFFNGATRPDDIVGAIKDDPDFGSDSPLAYGVRRSTAERILKARQDLGGEFTSIEQIDQVRGIGPDTLHDIYHSLAPPSQAYPVLLFPVRIETRFIGNELRVRIYPDDVLIQKHDGRLTPDEVQLLEQYQEEVKQAGTREKKKEAWHGLVERVGRTRAAYLHRIENIDAVGQKSDSWERSPSVRALPDHFLVCLYQGDDLKYQVRGKRIKGDLPLIADPADATTEKDPLYGNQAKWICDFEEAENKGMAVRITLANNEKEFSRIVVLGLNRESAEVGKDLVEGLLEDHRFTSGLSFLPYGTPTNNTETLTADYTADEKDVQSSFDVENQEVKEGSIGVDLAKAMGIDSADKCPFAYVKNAGAPIQKHDQSVRAALWPALGDYFLAHMLEPSLQMDYRERLWRHFQYFVQVRGPYPAILIGKQPYGILPVTDISNWQPSELDNVASDAVDGSSQGFFLKLHQVLVLLYRHWLASAKDPERVPRIGQSGDTDEELLQILAMQPASINQYVRAIVDDRFIAWLIRLMGESFLEEGINIESGASVDSATTMWGQLLRGSQADARSLLSEIAAKLNLGEEDLFLSPILRLFGWAEGVPLWNDSSREMIPLVAYPSATSSIQDNPIAYLSDFADPDTIPESDPEKPLLFDLLRRAMLYQKNEGYPFRDHGSIRHAIKHDLDYAGVVQEILVSESDEVLKGDVLLKIKSRQLSLMLDIRAPADGVIKKIHVKPDDQVQKNKKLLILEAFRHVNHTVSDTARNLSAFKRDLGSLEALVSETLDLHTHRLDAWLTSFATKRLTAMRNRKGFKNGVYVGAYGWVEDLKRDQQAFSENSGGYIHAHSLGQAAAGAVLRNAYLSEMEEDQDANAFRINLSSNRVRRASRILEGRREGQEIGALLGYQFERALHDNSLDKYIDNFRAIYPIVANRVTESEGEQPVGAIAARNVVDGLKLAREWENYQSDDIPQEDKTKIRNKWTDHDINFDNDRLLDSGLEKTLYQLIDSLDAVTDLLIYESVYQEVQGNYERSAAALDAMSGEGPPPEPESIQTPRNGVPFTQRISLMFEPHAGSSNGHRTDAEPTLSHWFENILGDMTKIGCVAKVLEYRDETDGALSTKKFINLNQATFAELEGLPEIGDALARDIIDDRTKNGYYKRIEDLTRISGIGDTTVGKLKGLVTVDKVELNMASQSELQELLGLSEVHATAIVNDREANGYYTSVNDLKRLDEIDEATFERIKKRLMVVMVDLNGATKEELEFLPGIGENLASDIIVERRKGAFLNVKDLQRRINGIGDEIIKGLKGLVYVTEPLRVSLDDLRLNPLDFLYLSHVTPAALASALGFSRPVKESMRAGDTEIEQRIRNYLSEQNLLDPNCVMAIDFYPAKDDFEKGIGEALEVARSVHDLVTSTKYLSPLALRRTEEAGVDPAYTWDHDELRNRVSTALEALKELIDDLPRNEGPVDPDVYFELSQFGIGNAISPSPLRDPYPDRKQVIRKTVEKRIAQCEQYIAEADELYSLNSGFSEKTKAVGKLDQAMKALFGDAFVTLPVMRPLRSDESTESQKASLGDIKEASGQSNILGNNDEQRVYLWLQQVAQTHPGVQRLENVMMLTEAWRQPAVTDASDCATTSVKDTPLQWKVLQLPYDKNRRWLALSDAELEEGLSQEDIQAFREKLAEEGRERGILSFVTASPGPIEFDGKITGLLIDDWNEWIPAPDLTTGVAFQYDRPNAQAPQALLLAVPPLLEKGNERPWTYDGLLNIVNDTLNLAKIRAVDIDALGSAEGRFFPATLIPSDADNPMWERDEVMPSLEDWLTLGPGCIDFRTMPVNEDFSDRRKGKFHFRAAGGKALTDRRDNLGDLSFLRIPNEGMDILLGEDVSRVKVVAAVFPGGEPVKIKLENAAGGTVKQFSPPATMRPVAMTADVAGIRKIAVTGGGGNLAVFEICVS